MTEWTFDLSSNKIKSDSVTKPPGYVANPTPFTEHDKVNNSTKKLRYQRIASGIAFAPAGGAFMNAFMMYMVGSSMNIFPLMMTFMTIYNSITQVMNVKKAFEVVKDANGILGYKFLYVLFSSFGFFLGMWNLTRMGLIPTSSADWIGNIPIPVNKQIGGVTYNF